MSDERGYSGFGEINALGNPGAAERVSEMGDRTDDGPIGNARPTRIMAEGIDISTSPTLFHDKSLRKGMSTTKNESLKRSMSGRK